MIIILADINKLLWGITTILLIGSGLYFSKKLKFIQFNIKEMIKGFKGSKDEKVSPFNTLMLTLAARIGVGSLAGVALAIYIGGPGTIFWMWISTLIVVPNAYVESFLGVLYHEKKDGFNQGGPSYYISKGLKKEKLAKLYAILIIVCYIFGFLTIQSNTISKSFSNLMGITPIVTGIIVAIITGLVIFKGVKGIIDVSSKIMPFIGILYVVMSCYILVVNIDQIPRVITLIVTEAFNYKSMGIGIITPFIIGFQRGIFSNEAGIGSGAIAAATVDNDDAKGQGMIQMAGIYFTSLVLCTLTALIIMLSDYNNIIFSNINGIELTQYALNYHLGPFGEILLLITIFIFAFSTIISGYYYGENSLKFLKKQVSKKDIISLKTITILLLIIGSVINPMFLWNSVDIFIAIMGIINIYAIIKLRNKVK